VEIGLGRERFDLRDRLVRIVPQKVADPSHEVSIGIPA